MKHFDRRCKRFNFDSVINGSRNIALNHNDSMVRIFADTVVQNFGVCYQILFIVWFNKSLFRFPSTIAHQIDTVSKMY